MLADFEATIYSDESVAPSSPASQELREFEAYNRTALPRLVEANLQAIVDTQMRPIEDNLRTLVVDIVRRCQSTVEENFRVIREPKVDTGSNSQPSASQNISLTQPRDNAFSNEGQVSASVTDMTHFFHEPPHMGMEASISNNDFLGPPNNPECPQNEYVDSGYGSTLDSCHCGCHFFASELFRATGSMAFSDLHRTYAET